MEQTYRFQERIHKEFLIYRACDHLIATTEEQAEQLRSDYDLTDRHITVIPPGIDENRFTPARSLVRQELRERFGLGPHTVYAVGRMAANKGYDLLLQAMPHVIRLAPEARLLLAAGSDAAQRDLDKEADLMDLARQIGVYDRVTWAQYIADEDLADYYRAAAVFALCSRYEPFGMTAVEAMACGTPTVITVHGGLHEAIDFGTQALYADPTAPEEYGAILALPLRHPRLAEELSIEGSRFARRTLAVFDQFKGKYTDTTAEVHHGYTYPVTFTAY